MALTDIGGHTIDRTALTDGCIIDIGCRGFTFAAHDYFKAKKVYAIDCDSEVFTSPPTNENLTLMNVGISDKSGEASYYRNPSCPEATCPQEIDEGKKTHFATCKTITMDELYEITGTNVDVLKLDCEGGEYVILGETFKPVPKQITVEFHYHCVPDLHNKVIDSILDRLRKDYEPVNLVWEAKHGAGFNFWDVLFVRKW